MNPALLSSKNMCWCTPQKFFNDLNDEFHFVLDAAATPESAKCPVFFTPEQDGLKQSWQLGGQCSAIPHMGAILKNGFKKHGKKHKTAQRLFC